MSGGNSAFAYEMIIRKEWNKQKENATKDPFNRPPDKLTKKNKKSKHHNYATIFS